MQMFCSANRLAMQDRGPNPKGKLKNGWNFSYSGDPRNQRSGLNFRGSLTY